jgi:intracellular septation protein A
MQQVWFLLLTLIPIAGFVLADMFGGQRTGIITAIALSIAMFFANWMLMGQIEPISLIEPVFFVILGLASLRMKNSIYFKFQPVVVNILSALLLAGFQVAGTPLLVRWAPAMDKVMPAELQGRLTHPLIMAKLALISHGLIYILLAHAALVAWAALKKSNMSWAMARVAGYPILLISVVFMMAV